jgi:hypothetical protein
MSNRESIIAATLAALGAERAEPEKTMAAHNGLVRLSFPAHPGASASLSWGGYGKKPGRVYFQAWPRLELLPAAWRSDFAGEGYKASADDSRDPAAIAAHFAKGLDVIKGLSYRLLTRKEEVGARGAEWEAGAAALKKEFMALRIDRERDSMEGAVYSMRDGAPALSGRVRFDNGELSYTPNRTATLRGFMAKLLFGHCGAAGEFPYLALTMRPDGSTVSRVGGKTRQEVVLWAEQRGFLPEKRKPDIAFAEWLAHMNRTARGADMATNPPLHIYTAL